MRLFNAFQLVVLFVVWPWIIQWLHSAGFAGHSALFYAASAAYVVHFGFMVFFVHEAISEVK